MSSRQAESHRYNGLEPAGGAPRYQLAGPVPPMPAAGSRGHPGEQPRQERRRAQARNESESRPSRVERFLGKSSMAKAPFLDKGMIGHPMPLATRSSPHLPYPFEEVRPPVPLKDNVPSGINHRNLGTAHETFHSHPPQIRRQGPGMGSSSRHGGSRGDKNRRCVVYEGVGNDEILVRDSTRTRNATVDHRRRRVEDPGADYHRERTLATRVPQSNPHRSPNPSSARDAHYGGRREVGAADRMPVPDIRLIAPPEDRGIRVPQGEPGRNLAPSDAYRVLHQKAVKEIDRLKPLVRKIAEAENLETYNAADLEEALETIIDDRRKLERLVPLAAKLCEDQLWKFDPDRFEVLTEVLGKVLQDRDMARYAASHHKKANRHLEGRVLLLEGRVDKLEGELGVCRREVHEVRNRQGNAH
ncbi:hypothetical protein GGS20DRAFT_547325 [Poronia punctata]|nr:hypothetical protein GGS20DRAFT_547325 [Poronia punctata]